MTKCKYICSHCGSENVLRDAWAAWDVDTQTWVLASVFYAGFCDHCEGEVTVKAVEIASESYEPKLTNI
jgi:hypothetical protein